MKNKIDKNEILKMMVNSGSIDYDDVPKTMKDLDLLDLHNYEIWYSENANYWITHVKDETRKGNKRRVKRRKKEDLIKYLVAFYKGKTKDELRFRDFYLEWLEYRKIKVSDRTRNKDIDNYNRYYANNWIANKIISEIKLLDVEKFLCTTVKDNGLDKKQIYNMRSVLNDVLEYALMREIITNNPAANYKIPKNIITKRPKPDSVDEVFTPEEQAKILHAIENRRNEWNLAYMAVALTFNLGLRVGELATLKWSDVKDSYIAIQRQEVSYQRVLKDGTKGELITRVEEQPKSNAGFRVLYLTKEARKVLAKTKEIAFKFGWYNKDGYIFVGKNGRLTVRQLEKPMETICIKLKIKRRNIHKIRKTFISSLIDKDINLEEVRRLSGHEKINTLLDSYCYNREDKKETEEKIERATAR